MGFWKNTALVQRSDSLSGLILWDALRDHALSAGAKGRPSLRAGRKSPHRREEGSELRMEKNKAVLVYRQSKSYHGLRIDELKSHMQKSVRRGAGDEACKAFSSMTNMLELFPNEPMAKAIRTNALNRVLVCVLEDVGAANPTLVLYVLRRLLPMSWRKQRKPFSLAAALECLQLMAASPKSRITSHLYHAYGVAANRELALEQRLPVGNVDLSTAPLSNPNCFRCWDQGKQAQDLVMNRFFQSEHAARLDGVCWLKEAYAQLSEKRPVVAFALACAHLDLSAESMLYKGACVSENALRAYKQHDFDLEILADAVDVHTARGRQSGRTAADFRHRGAAVEREDPRLHNDALLYIYTHTKK